MTQWIEAHNKGLSVMGNLERKEWCHGWSRDLMRCDMVGGVGAWDDFMSVTSVSFDAEF